MFAMLYDRATVGATSARAFDVLRPSLVAAGIVLAAATYVGPAFAVEPSSGVNGGPGRFSDRGMLEAARGMAATKPGAPVNIGIPPPDELRVLEARREAELKRLSEKLKRAAEARGPQPPVEVSANSPWLTDVAVAKPDLEPDQRSGLGARPSDGYRQVDESAGRATILIVMAGSGSLRDSSRGSDPILCVDNGCYVSNGAQAPSTYHSFSQSLSLGGRFGRGAGECNHSNVCVFRNVDIGDSGAMVQPINLRLVRHDRREQAEAAIDTSCRVIEGRLSCARPITTTTYTMWVVPETMARDIGPELLTGALSGGLRTAQTAELPLFRQ